MDVATDFLGNPTMNKIMGVVTVNENDDFMVPNVACYPHFLDN
jgi:hypothetical protein